MAERAPEVVEAVPIAPGEGPATGANGEQLPFVWGFSQEDIERAQAFYEQQAGQAEQQAASGGPQRRQRQRARASSPHRQRRGRAEGGSSAPAEMAAGFTSGQYVAMEKPSSVEVLAAAQYVKAVQKATGMQPAGKRAGNRNLYAQGHVQQVDAVAEQMREHRIMQSVQLPDMVSSCKQLYDVAMGNQAELGPDMTRLKVLRCVLKMQHTTTSPAASPATPAPPPAPPHQPHLRHPTIEDKMLMVYTDQQAADLEAAGWRLQNDWRFVPPAAPLPEAVEVPVPPAPHHEQADQTGQTGQQQPPAPASDQVAVPSHSAMPKSLKVNLDEQGRAALKTKAFLSFTGEDQKSYSPMSRWTTDLMKAAWGDKYHSTRQNVIEALQIAVWINMNPNLTAGDGWSDVRDAARKHATAQKGAGRFCWFKAAEAERLQVGLV